MSKETYDRLALPLDITRGNHCGVTCVSVITGKSLSECMELFRSHYHLGKRWAGSTTHVQRETILKSLGVELEEQPLRRRMTLQRFVEYYARPDHVYMIRTTRHAQLVMNGICVDQCGVKPISEYRGRRKFVSLAHIVKG